MMIPFIRVFPNGNSRIQEIDRPQEIYDLACRFLALEGRLLVKIDDQGNAVFGAAIFQNGEEFDAAIEQCGNGPEIDDAVDRLIRTATENQAKFLKGAKPPFVGSVARH